VSTKTFTERREEAAKLGLVADSIFMASPVHRHHVHLESAAAEKAAEAKAARKEAKAYAGKPHHAKLAELRAMSPVAANIYEQTNAFALRAEREEDEPPPHAA